MDTVNETCFDPYDFSCNSRKKGCDSSNSNTFWSIYQRQKIIQGTVRVPSSLYTMNLAGLSVYQSPIKENNYVNWNQMSDRSIPHIQTACIPTTKSTKHSYTWHRPCSQSPGGKGVDIKHNSYNRYLNRIKGKAPLRRGVTPVILKEIPYNAAFPVYGGKTFKTSIVNGCNCPVNEAENISLFNNNQQYIFDEIYNYTVGQKVIICDNETGDCDLATIEEILDNNQYLIKLLNDGVTIIASSEQLSVQKYLDIQDYLGVQGCLTCNQ